ncbi:hypothetical protein GW915_01515 [bacterium]|nr:hypothetical protein [bacterium]
MLSFTKAFILNSLFVSFSFVTFVGVSQAKADRNKVAAEVASDMKNLRAHWSRSNKAKFLKEAFPWSSQKDRDYLVAEWEEQTKDSTDFPFPTISSSGDKVLIGDEGQIKISLVDAKKHEFLINGVPFILNPKMGLRYTFLQMRKHFETVLAQEQSCPMFELVPSAHAGLFQGGLFKGGFWRSVGEAAVIGFGVYGVYKFGQKIGFFENSPKEKLKRLDEHIRNEHEGH